MIFFIINGERRRFLKTLLQNCVSVYRRGGCKKGKMCVKWGGHITRVVRKKGGVR